MKMHFVIEGEWLTNHCRGLWAREDRQDLAIKTLVEGVHGFDEAMALRVVTGKAKLVGDSDSGMRLEDDSAEMPSCVDTMARMRRKLDESEDELKDVMQLRNGDTAIVGSPTGRRMVPQRKRDAWPEAKSFIQIDDDSFGGSPFFGKEEEDVKETPPMAEKLTAKHNFGWLSPGGEFYPCDYSGHYSIVSRLGFLSERDAEKKGWAKLGRSMAMKDPDFFGFCDVGLVRPTAIQVEMVQRYCEERGIEVPYWARSHDDWNDKTREQEAQEAK